MIPSNLTVTESLDRVTVDIDAPWVSTAPVVAGMFVLIGVIAAGMAWSCAAGVSQPFVTIGRTLFGGGGDLDIVMGALFSIPLLYLSRELMAVVWTLAEGIARALSGYSGPARLTVVVTPHQLIVNGTTTMTHTVEHVAQVYGLVVALDGQPARTRQWVYDLVRDAIGRVPSSSREDVPQPMRQLQQLSL